MSKALSLGVVLGVVSLSTGALAAADASSSKAGAASSPISVSPKGHYAALDSLPDWGGSWFLNWSPASMAGVAPLKLKGKYLEAFEKWRAQVKANDGVVSSASNCLPPGMPIMMAMPQYPIEFFFTPGRVVVHHEAWMQWRNIYTDRRTHPDDLDPTFMGDSVGHWEGGTLVIETVALKEDQGLTLGTRGPIPAHSPKLRVIERIHLDAKDANTLVVELRLEDPDALAEPYQQTISYKRNREQPLLEFVCAENDRNPVDAQGNTTFQHQ